MNKLADEITKEVEVDAETDEISQLADLLDAGADFCWEVCGKEYRLIHENAIEEIHRDEVRDLTEECFLGGCDMDKNWWIAIDWDKTAENVRQSDGYGHHFSSYDGSEEFVSPWYIFRTN